MTLVVFVAPIFSPAASQMIEAAASLSGVQLAVVAQQSLDQLAPHIAARLIGHWRVDDITDTGQLDWAVRELAARLGPIDRLFGAYEQAQLPLALVREGLGIAGLPSATAHNFRDKARMKDVLRAAGIPVARHRLVARREDALDFVREVGFPIVVKPPAGAGAVATHRITDVAGLDAFLAMHPASPAQPLLAEEFLRGTEHSLETISINGRAVWHSLTHYRPTPLTVLENPWIQWGVVLPRELDHPQFDDIKRVGDQALAALGMTTGITHCEWFRRADGTVAISEIAARPPGAQITTMVARAHDVDFIGAWARLMVTGTFTPPTQHYAVATAYLRGAGRGHIVAVDGLDHVHAHLGALICDVRLPTLGHAPSSSYEGDGFIMLRHPETAVVERALLEVISTVRVQLG
jgi:phosphoribosylaminoimidazole carboxylase (NCAIR synthetase)